MHSGLARRRVSLRRLRIEFWGIGLRFGTRFGIVDGAAPAGIRITNRLRIGGRFLHGRLWT